VILYLDTSSLVKLYVQEVHADRVQRWVRDAEIVATSRVAFPEAIAAFARRFREKDITEARFKLLREALGEQWQQFALLDMDEVAAGGLAVKHGLRGLDAIHLEAALAMRTGAGVVRVAFGSFDRQLNVAAEAEGLPVLDVLSS